MVDEFLYYYVINGCENVGEEEEEMDVKWLMEEVEVRELELESWKKWCEKEVKKREVRLEKLKVWLEEVKKEG